MVNTFSKLNIALVSTIFLALASQCSSDGKPISAASILAVAQNNNPCTNVNFLSNLKDSPSDLNFLDNPLTSAGAGEQFVAYTAVSPATTKVFLTSGTTDIRAIFTIARTGKDCSIALVAPPDQVSSCAGSATAVTCDYTGLPAGYYLLEFGLPDLATDITIRK